MSPVWYSHIYCVWNSTPSPHLNSTDISGSLHAVISPSSMRLTVVFFLTSVREVCSLSALLRGPPFQDDSSWQNIVEQPEGCSAQQSSREEVERANDDVYFPPHIYGALLLPHCWLLVYMLSFVLAEWIYFKHYWDIPLLPAATFVRGFPFPLLPV